MVFVSHNLMVLKSPARNVRGGAHQRWRSRATEFPVRAVSPPTTPTRSCQLGLPADKRLVVWRDSDWHADIAMCIDQPFLQLRSKSNKISGALFDTITSLYTCRVDEVKIYSSSGNIHLNKNVL